MTEATPRPPDFLCIGAQKSGTTWLHHQLSRQPGLWLPAIKELHYFDEAHIPGHRGWAADHRARQAANLLGRHGPQPDPEQINWRLIDELSHVARGPISDDWYRALFGRAPQQSVAGEITPAYALLPAVGIDHALALNPDMKIIYLVREPIDRAWSQMRMIMRGLGNAWTLEDCLASAPFSDISNRSNYSATLDAWRRRVPAERFLLLNFDDIAAAPERLLRDVLAFLGVPCRDTGFERLHERHHVGDEYDMPDAIRGFLRAQLGGFYECPHPQLAPLMATWHR